MPLVLNSSPSLSGWSDLFSSVTTSVVKTVAPIALAPLYLPTKLGIDAAAGLVKAAAPTVKSAAGVVGSAVGTVGGAAETVLKKTGQAIQTAKGGNAPLVPPTSNLPLVLGGVAAAAILAFALFGKRRAS
jgi:hypothetical protein